MKRRTGILLMIFLTSSLAQAGSISASKITSLVATNKDAYLVAFGRDITSSPSCATVKRRFSFKVSTPAGKAMLATVLTAQVADSAVYVTGDGTCSVWSDSETAKTIEIRNVITTGNTTPIVR
ncbi:MAG: hypothetical protein ACAH59_06385 [Pseudobdellovibrionaceae bacterium]